MCISEIIYLLRAIRACVVQCIGIRDWWAIRGVLLGVPGGPGPSWGVRLRPWGGLHTGILLGPRPLPGDWELSLESGLEHWELGLEDWELGLESGLEDWELGLESGLEDREEGLESGLEA